MSRHFYFLIVVFLLIFTLKTQAETVVPNQIKENITWTRKGSPYIVKDDLVIEERGSLVIEPGVEIIIPFREDKLTKIIVRGNFFAKGKETEQISFVSSRHQQASWQGIIFEDSSADSSVVEYTKIENARCAIACFQASPKIQHNIFSKNEVAIVCENRSSPSIVENTIVNNGMAEIYPSAIHCSLWSNPLISKNVIENNFGHSIYCDVYSSPVISENKISNVLGANIVCSSFSNPKIISNDLTEGGSEFGIILYQSSPEIIKNKINDKRIYGLTAVNSLPNVYDNIFSQNFISVFCIRSSPTIMGNDISQSDIALVLAEGSKPELKNNNISSNSTEIKLIRNNNNINFTPNSIYPSEQISIKKMPSGQKILILFRSFYGGNWNIGLLDKNDSTWTMLTKNNFHSGSASWSPDGNHIAFTSKKDDNWDIFIMDSPGGNISNITNTPLYTEEAPPMWSPDGNKLCFERETPECQTVIMDIATKEIKKINLKKSEEEYPGLYPLVFTWIH